MAKPPKDAGMIQLLLNRLNEERLPEALKLQDKVRRGECLSEYDMQFMKNVLRDTGEARRLAAKYPEYQNLVDRMTALYGDIASQAWDISASSGTARFRIILLKSLPGPFILLVLALHKRFGR